jgi:ketosteroid isomerase-like protein
VAALTLAALVCGTRGGGGEAEPSKRAVEIRCYTLKPGAREEFHRLAAEVAVPMLRRWKIDVVAHGPSPHDDRSYYLIRSFDSLADRQRAEDAFYGSDEWQKGPRDAVLALIDTYATTVMELAPNAIEGLRPSPPPPGEAPPPASVEDDRRIVAALDTEYQEAVKRNDAASMARILHEDFVLVLGDGKTFDREDLLREARAGAIQYERQDEDPGTQIVRVFGDTAVVTARLWIKGTSGGTAFDRRLWFSDTYVRTPAGWRYAFGQASLRLPAESGGR